MAISTYLRILVAVLLLVRVFGSGASEERVPKLLELASHEFALTSSDKIFFRAVARGEVADYSESPDEDVDPYMAEEWSEKRVLHASRIMWLCVDPEASALVTNKGVLVHGVRIAGALELETMRVEFPIALWSCSMLDGITVAGAELRCLLLTGTHVTSLNGEGLKAHGDVRVNEGFRAEGPVNLAGARIGGDLNCTQGEFLNPGGTALDCDGISVEGSVFLSDNFVAVGEVRLQQGTIYSELICTKGSFLNSNGIALLASGVNVGGAVFLNDGFEAEGEVHFLGAEIGRNLECEGGQFRDPGARALCCDYMRVKGSVFLRGFLGGKCFKATGEVRFPGARIDGSLECDRGEFRNGNGRALSCDRIKVGGSIHLRHIIAEGEVRFLGARIDGNLECIGSRFVNPDGSALSCDGVILTGDLFLSDGFAAAGKVTMIGASIGGNLECRQGNFLNPNGIALICERMQVRNNVFLDKAFRAEGIVSLGAAEIKGSVSCKNGHFINADDFALHASGMMVEGDVMLTDNFEAVGTVDLSHSVIGGRLECFGIASTEKVTLDLRFAQVRTLCDAPDSWPESGNLLLYGLAYEDICTDVPSDAANRIRWLHRQPLSPFYSQPYEQLAAMFRGRGNDAEAKTVLIQKNKDWARVGNLSFPEWLWHHVFGPLIGYGYRPLKILWVALVLLALGWVLYGFGYARGLITATKEADFALGNGYSTRALEETYPRFNPLAYSLDVLVPLLSFHQENYWLPNARRGSRLISFRSFALRTGGLLQFLMWTQTISGWIIFTLLVGGLSGIVRT